jgi:RNA polymerase sigma factor (sigma-70 family)
MPYSMFELGRGLLGSYADGEPLPGRTGKNAEVPYNWTVHARPDGVELASPNCLECHAGRWNGELLVGLGKADADYTRDLSGTLTTVAGLDLTTPGSDDLVRWAERLQAVAPYTLAPNVGVNPADTLAVVLAAHRDRRTLAWSGRARAAPPGRDDSGRHAAVVVGEEEGRPLLQRHGPRRSSGHSDVRLDVVHRDRRRDAGDPRVLQRHSRLRPECRAAHLPVRDRRGARGEWEPLFEASCAGCHGLYGSDPDADWYPSLLLPLEVVGTDPVMAGSVTEYAEFIRWFNESPFGEVTTLVADDPFIGYVAPPLDGIWATAPFLHNGSVPTLELVLDSSRRPKYWRRVDYDSTHFDEARIGWPFVELDLDDTGGADGLPASDRKHVYDTTRFGYGNGGHPFGDSLHRGRTAGRARVPQDVVSDGRGLDRLRSTRCLARRRPGRWRSIVRAPLQGLVPLLSQQGRRRDRRRPHADVLLGVCRRQGRVSWLGIVPHLSVLHRPQPALHALPQAGTPGQGHRVRDRLVADLGAGPGTIAAAKAEQKLLLQALRRIPVDFQIAVELYYWEGLSTRELAEVLDVPEGTVRSRLARAREHLAKQMHDLAQSPALAESTIGDFERWARSLKDSP